MALIESCSGISKSFGSRVLFENISLGISEGERLGLIGPNGSGKSTLLKILSGRLEPDTGTVSMRRNTRVGYAAFRRGEKPRNLACFSCVLLKLPDLDQIRQAQRRPLL